MIMHKRVMLKTTKTPCSIAVSKEQYAAIYKESQSASRRIHVVFPSRSKTAMVEEKLAAWLVETYPYISYVTDEPQDPSVITKEDIAEAKSKMIDLVIEPPTPEQVEEAKTKKMTQPKKATKNGKGKPVKGNPGKSGRPKRSVEHV